jgi:excisionase family DNA binding protein
MSTTDPAGAFTEALRLLIAQQVAPPPPEPPRDRLLRATTVASRLGCSKAHVHDLWESGKLPCVVLPSATAPSGRAKRIRESDPGAWIATLGHDRLPRPPGSARGAWPIDAPTGRSARASGPRVPRQRCHVLPNVGSALWQFAGTVGRACSLARRATASRHVAERGYPVARPSMAPRQPPHQAAALIRTRRNMMPILSTRPTDPERPDPVAQPQPRMLRIDEVAARLQIGRSTAYRLCQQHRLPTLIIGKAVRVPADALEEWLRRNIQGA